MHWPASRVNDFLAAVQSTQPDKYNPTPNLETMRNYFPLSERWGLAKYREESSFYDNIFCVDTSQ